MKLLTAAEAGRVLGISSGRVRVLIRSGRLKAERVGRDWVIEPKALRAVRVRLPGRPPKAKPE